MEKKQRTRIRILPFTLLLWAGLVIFDREGWGWLSLTASALHEIGHLIAMRLAGVSVKELVLYPFGPVIRTGSGLTSYRTDLAVFSAGIAANLFGAGVTCLLCTMFPSLWEKGGMIFLAANLALGAINALPHPVLDGGGILRVLLLMRLPPDRADRVCGAIGDAGTLMLACFVLYLLFYGEGGVSIYLLCAYLVLALAKERRE